MVSLEICSFYTNICIPHFLFNSKFSLRSWWRCAIIVDTQLGIICIIYTLLLLKLIVFRAAKTALFQW